MRLQQATKPIKGQEPVYDDSLHSRFLSWRKISGYSLKRIATMIRRSETAISQYTNKKYEGDINALEKDIHNLLRREEKLDFQGVQDQKYFCPTMAANLTWEVLQYCDETCQMGTVTGESGIGKTETCKEYKRRNNKSIYIVSDISTRRVSPILRLIAKNMGGPHAVYSSASNLLHGIIDRLKNSHRLIIIDESHFLSWESLEAIRKLHDAANVGIVYAGMQRLYDQMKGDNSKAYLYEQIYSRISIYRKINFVTERDVKLITNSLCPGLNGQCMRFLYGKASGVGKFRTLCNLLKNAIKMHKEFNTPIDLDLLKAADEFLMTASHV